MRCNLSERNNILRFYLHTDIYTTNCYKQTMPSCDWYSTARLMYNNVTWKIRAGIFSTKRPFFSPFLTSRVSRVSRSLLALGGRGDDWGEMSGDEGADLRETHW